MVKFQGKHWFISITRNFFFFHNCLDSLQYFYLKKYGLAKKEPLVISKNGRLGFIFNNREQLKKYNKSVEKICLSPTKLKKLEAKYYKFGKELLIASFKLEKEITHKTFKDFLNAYKNLSPGLYLTSAIGRHMSELLMDKLKKAYPSISQSKLDILIAEITYPEKHTPLSESQISLLEIGAELQENKIAAENIKTHSEIYKKFKRHFNKYSVIPVNFNEDPWDENNLLEQLKNLMRNYCRIEKDKLLKQHQEKIKKSKELISKIKNKEIKNIANSLKVGTLLNEYRKFVFCRASLAYRPLFRKIAEKYNLSEWRECGKFTPDEIISLYFDKNEKILDVLPTRNWVGVISANNKNGYRLLSEKELSLFLTEIEAIVPDGKKLPKDEEIREIKGMIANPGVVQGTAKIILGASDFHKFNDGDIIVTTMTSVDFVPLMGRASAFITNEGGITSHASIVSRELNKPCIIGTKIATKILKDGDLVEVDANRGLVKIIKK